MTAHIAQMNMGYLRHPFGDPRIAEFENNSDLVNGIADRSPGFIWRLSGTGYDLPENDMGRLFGRLKSRLQPCLSGSASLISLISCIRLYTGGSCRAVPIGSNMSLDRVMLSGPSNRGISRR